MNEALPRPLWRCRKCEHAWFPKKGTQPRPERCPRCRSRRWMVRRGLPGDPAGPEEVVALPADGTPGGTPATG